VLVVELVVTARALELLELIRLPKIQLKLWFQLTTQSQLVLVVLHELLAATLFSQLLLQLQAVEAVREITTQTQLLLSVVLVVVLVLLKMVSIH
jgi:hypothetical protein